MKHLYFVSLIGLLLIGQTYGASSSNSIQLPPIVFNGPITQFTHADYWPLPHASSPYAASIVKSTNGKGYNYRDMSEIECTQIQEEHQKINTACKQIRLTARNSQAYTNYRAKSIYDYYIWSGGIAALLGLGLWGMHKHDMLSVNWKHILLCAALASSVGICAATDNAYDWTTEEAMTRLRSDPRWQKIAAGKLLYGFVYTPDRSRFSLEYEGYFNQLALGTPADNNHHVSLRTASNDINRGNFWYATSKLPLRDLTNVDNDTIDQLYEHAQKYICENLASDDKLGRMLAAKDKQYSLPKAIPAATIAAGVVSGIELLRDYRLSRIQG